MRISRPMEASSECGEPASTISKKCRSTSPQCACGLYRRLGIRKVFAGVRDSLCGGTAPLPRIRLAVCAAAVHQMAVPEVDSIDGLPPAVALQQQRGSPTTSSSVGSVTTLSNLLRMLYSRAGDYPQNQPLLYAESFSPNTPEGACPNCHGIGRVHAVDERSWSRRC